MGLVEKTVPAVVAVARSLVFSENVHAAAQSNIRYGVITPTTFHKQLVATVTKTSFRPEKRQEFMRTMARQMSKAHCFTGSGLTLMCLPVTCSDASTSCSTSIFVGEALAASYSASGRPPIDAAAASVRRRLFRSADAVASSPLSEPPQRRSA